MRVQGLEKDGDQERDGEIVRTRERERAREIEIEIITEIERDVVADGNLAYYLFASINISIYNKG